MSEEEVINVPATSGSTPKSPALGRKKSEGDLKLIYCFFDDKNYLTAILCTYFIISLAVFSSMCRWQWSRRN